MSLPPPRLLLCVAAAALHASMAEQPSSSSQQAAAAAAAAPVPTFMFRWHENRAAFRAGETAVVMIKALDLPDWGEARRSMTFTATVNGRRGNSTYITDVAAHLEGEPDTWNLTFVPLRADGFVVLTGEERFDVGPLDIAKSTCSWK
uniref:GEX2 N-terminal Ig-like domain-containing protein n=1 Tax=Oryza brachyantha TaxID=4533 RepID=J3MXL8_ORYBR